MTGSRRQPVEIATRPPATDAEEPPSCEDAGLSRRHFLERLGAIGVAGALAGTGVLEAASGHKAGAVTTAATTQATGASSKPAHQWCMVIDLRYCNGCKVCTAACQEAHYLHKDQTWIHVFTMTNASGNTYHMPRPCMMCEDPPCVQVCPVKANFRTDEGLVLVNQSRCIGTRICMNACPYQARYFNWGPAKSAPRQPFPQEPEWPVPQVEGTVGKCIFCAAMLPMGKIPECVSNCPMDALYMGDLTTDVAVNASGQVVKLSEFLAANDAVKFKESYGTHPRVYYILGHDQDLENDEGAG
ncbi:MAG: 4Fe-4S dicluster domain-containing protein [Actinobacteria bacterium]|jgi:molybdopterin-containing oxidoreductase family iron-sulfur binding subunit|nr:4Fe-4S dicluster domain-containing protein [Actinomycetota bacterium]